ncbi:carboxymuconolactone decarboxylase family protein [Pacificibacter marinus]|uniref:carboxymuconolactone decarboxylase family protein n=1 Tax=Pacificibacter marinus TaxID=658057 RepID=UPI001C077CB4|nr:carboxymuconolactone decarboxylase family protein [Pacificibacter marinus]MBU2868612.1 carboxymuconolactone decarboxylase family protein [Pacificibacter marinus]
MNDFAKYLEQMMEQGTKMAKSLNPALETFQMPDFSKLMPTMTAEQMEIFWGTGFNKDGLDAKTRFLVILAGQTVLGAQAEEPFKVTVRHALDAGATQQQIAQTIYQMSMLGGLPAMSKALGLATQVFAEQQEDSA